MSQRIEHKAKRIVTLAGKNKISAHTSRLSKLDQFLTTRSHRMHPGGRKKT